MSWDTELADLMAATVTVAPVSSYDEYGARTYGTAVSYAARVVEALTRVITQDGREGISTTTVYLAPHASSGIPNVGPEAKVTLPDGTTPPIMAVETYPDEDGDYYWVLRLGASGPAPRR